MCTAGRLPSAVMVMTQDVISASGTPDSSPYLLAERPRAVGHERSARKSLDLLQVKTFARRYQTVEICQLLRRDLAVEAGNSETFSVIVSPNDRKTSRFSALEFAGLLLLSNATYAGCRIVPPLVLQQEALAHHVIWPSLPGFTDKALVLKQRLDAGRAATALQCALAAMMSEPDRLLRGLFPMLNLLARRRGEVGGPVHVGFDQRGWR